jgi:hypothetical protein
MKLATKGEGRKAKRRCQLQFQDQEARTVTEKVIQGYHSTLSILRMNVNLHITVRVKA